MKPQDVLLALAAGKPGHGNRAFGGYCVACERPMFKQHHFKDERVPGWVKRANSYRCDRCATRRRMQECGRQVQVSS